MYTLEAYTGLHGNSTRPGFSERVTPIFIFFIFIVIYLFIYQ